MATEGHIRSVFVEDVLVVGSTPGHVPEGEEWEALCRSLDSGRARAVLVVAGDTSITSIQRGRIGEISKRHGLTAAILTDSSVVRGVVTAVSWFGVRAKAFKPSAVDEAVEYLALSGEIAARVNQAAADLEKDLNRYRRPA